MNFSFRSICIVFAISSFTASGFASSREEVLQRFFAQATQIAPSEIEVRALVRTGEPAWSAEQIKSEVERQMSMNKSGSAGLAVTISNGVASTHAGVRWVLFDEIKLPKFYRVDIKDYANVEPPADQTLSSSNGIFQEFHINNYGRQDLDYTECHSFLDGTPEIVLDNSLTPLKWLQENLYLARYVEARASMGLVMLLAQPVAEADRQRVIDEVGPENSGMLPPVKLDENKFQNLLRGGFVGGSFEIKPVEDNTNRWSIQLSVEQGGKHGVVRFFVDESLPYFVYRVTTEANGDSYNSERSGVTDFGYPSIWRSESREKGKLTTREIRILSVSTNIDYARALVTNRLGFWVWEKGRDNQMREIPDRPNPIPVVQAPPPETKPPSEMTASSIPASDTSSKSGTSPRKLILVFILMVVIPFSVVYVVRRQK